MRLLALAAASLLTCAALALPSSTHHASSAVACPFCLPAHGKTLIGEIQSARFVIYGTPSNAKVKFDTDGREISSTDLTIEEVIKSDPFIKDKKKLTLPRYIPSPGPEPDKLIVFCDIYNDQADTYLYLTTKDGALAKYLKEVMKLDENDIPKRLRFFFDYIDNADTEISGDAYKEFAKAEYADVVKMVKQYGDKEMQKRLKSWFKDPNTPAYRFGLIGLMLGLYGDKSDGETFLDLLNDTDPQRSLLTGIDGVLAGYILSDRDNGWTYTKQLVTGVQNDFNKRYAGLRSIRFFYETHNGHVSQDELLEALSAMLDQSDAADMVIEDLRKWKQWKFTDKIMGLREKESHNTNLVHRAILRYAVACPTDKFASAKTYVDQLKKDNPAKWKETVEQLELEKAAQVPTEAEARNAK